MMEGGLIFSTDGINWKLFISGQSICMKISCNKNILPSTLPKITVAQAGISFSNQQQKGSLWKWFFQTVQIIFFPFLIPFWMEINSEAAKLTHKFKSHEMLMF